MEVEEAIGFSKVFKLITESVSSVWYLEDKDQALFDSSSQIMIAMKGQWEGCGVSLHSWIIKKDILLSQRSLLAAFSVFLCLILFSLNTLSTGQACCGAQHVVGCYAHSQPVWLPFARGLYFFLIVTTVIWYFQLLCEAWWCSVRGWDD